tara:strand:+ start:495 stop:728 length:234 start_codon:yes stop_codon:yes gene_type:complete
MAALDPGKQAVAIMKNNYIGALLGVGATYMYVTKKTSITKMYMIVGISLLGGVAGGYAQSMLGSKSGSIKSSQEAKK